MIFNRKNYTDEQLVQLYKAILKPRMIEQKMLILLRQGKISKWFSGIGQEAIAVGVTEALHQDEYILPLHRNLGVFTSRDIPLYRLFAQFQGKQSGFTKGRDRSFHFGSRAHHIVGMISHLGPQMSVGCGIALAHLLNKDQKVAVAFCGDGGTSEGEFHEAMNMAAVWNLPVIFIVENNGYGLSTPTNEQYKCEHISDKGIGYGMDAIQIDGNNILEVYATLSQLAESIRNKPQPVLVEALTFRMRGHEEASGTKYVPQNLMETWSKKDPVENYERYLIAENVLSLKQIESIKNEIKSEIEEHLQIAFAEEATTANLNKELNDVYLPHKASALQPKNDVVASKRMIDAISDALDLCMQKYPDLVLMGQDIAEYGGVFKITENFVQEYGRERVRNTPICESAVVGIALGLSIMNKKSMVEMQFADFVSCAFNQIVNNAAKLHYRWGQNVDTVIRMPTGANTQAGPFHSQSNEAWFFHTPGLKIVYPSNPYDAKGLLCAAFEDPNPVMFFEHKFLYRSISEEIPSAYYTCEIGKAKYISQGEDITIITYGLGVLWAKAAMEEIKEYSANIVDLRTLLPWDQATVQEAVQKTGKVLILHEDTLTGGIGGEIAAWIAEHCFEHLDAPVMREASLDTPVPFTKALENQFLPLERLKVKIQKLLNF